MPKNQDAGKCKLEKHIPLKYKEIEKSFSQLIRENRIMIKYSIFYERDSKFSKQDSKFYEQDSEFYEQGHYWFGIPEKKFKKFSSQEKSFVLLLLGCNTKREKDVIVLPTTYLLKFLENVRTADDGSWKIHIYLFKNIKNDDDTRFKISATGKEKEEVSDYFNRFDLIRDEAANSTEQNAFSEEIIEEDKYYEGAIKQIKINRYERDLEARNKCIAHYGLSCCICGFNFEKKYGSLGEGFIHVHHLKPLSEIRCEYKLEPIQDLRPVCPNCHALIHRRRPPYSIEEILKALNQS